MGDNMKNILKNKKLLIILTIIIGLGISLSVIYFMYYYKDSRLNSLTNGLISIEFHETSTVILTSDVPVIDEIGLEGSPYEFTLKNTSQVPINANIKVNPTIRTNISLGAVRYGIYINDELVKKDYIHEDKILYTLEELLVDEEIECKIYFWVDYYYEEPGKIFEASIIAEGETRDILWNPSVINFDVNNQSEYTFKIKNDGIYLLEVWGAQGGLSTNKYATNVGGYGGYSNGTIHLSPETILYINVGEQPLEVTSIYGSAGGYNGGGSGGDSCNCQETREYFGGAGGGGATHIALSSGTLNMFENKVSDLLIVSGGGGGATSHWNQGMNGGNAGGYLGNAGINCFTVSSSEKCSNFTSNNDGGSQNSGYAFGLGQSGIQTADNQDWSHSGRGGGGGGYYGGYTSQTLLRGASAGGGGSGYLSSSLTDAYMACYDCTSNDGLTNPTYKTNNVNCAEEDPTPNCAKIGNGYARITYLRES